MNLLSQMQLLSTAGAKDWAFVSTAVTGPSTNVQSVSFGTTTQAGDVVVVLGTTNNSLGTPSGWTKIASTNLCFYRIAGAGETALTYNFSGSSQLFVAMVFRPVGGSAVFSTGVSVSGNPPPTQNLSTSGSPTLVVAHMFCPGSISFTPVLPPGAVTVQSNSGGVNTYFSAYAQVTGATTGDMLMAPSFSATPTNVYALFHIT